MLISQYKEKLHQDAHSWLVTGAAGFIGSNLVEELLKLGQRVIGLDNFSTGRRENLEDVERLVGEKAWKRFTLCEADIANYEACRLACEGVEYVLQQAAFVSVPRSFKDPLLCTRTNVLGFVNMILAAKQAGVKRFVYASSSSVYGDHPGLPKVESEVGRQLSPYAVSKYAGENYAHVFSDQTGMGIIGLRYFNVFGPRQNPAGDYAAVVPKFTSALLERKAPAIYGDGETSRDFCYIDNVIQANLLASLTENSAATDKVYNIAVGTRTTLNQLYTILRNNVAKEKSDKSVTTIEPEYRPFRVGDIQHSLADISLAKKFLGYNPMVVVEEGLERLVHWMAEEYRNSVKV